MPRHPAVLAERKLCKVVVEQLFRDLSRERLAFRDALRRNAELRSEYEALKLRLALEHPDDRGAYTRGKRDFVVRVLATVGERLGQR